MSTLTCVKTIDPFQTYLFFPRLLNDLYPCNFSPILSTRDSFLPTSLAIDLTTQQKKTSSLCFLIFIQLLTSLKLLFWLSLTSPQPLTWWTMKFYFNALRPPVV